MARYMYLLVAFLLVSSFAIGQTIQGKIVDQNTGEGLPFANVVLEKDGVQKAGTTTDLDGNYSLTGFDPGTYNLKVIYVGYQDKLTTGIVIGASKTVPLDIDMSNTAVRIDEIVVVAHKVPLIEPDNTASGATVTGEEIAKLPTKSVDALISTTAGVSLDKQGEDASIRGGREGDAIIYVDGVRTRRGNTVPAADIEQLQVITGGLPAEYGDVTGGVINITTKGPASKFSGNAEVETSQFLDPFGYNFVALGVGGPLLKSKSETNERVIIGYRLSGQYRNQKDPNPSWPGAYTATDEFKNLVATDPLVPSVSGEGLEPRANFITADDIVRLKYRPNTNAQNYNINGKFDFSVTEDVNVTVGGNYLWIKNKTPNDARWLLTPESQRDRYETDYRVYLRLRQKIGGSSLADDATDEEKEAQTSSLIQNINYTIQGDYSRYTRVIEDPRHKDNLWAYGYVGEYNRELYTGFDAEEQFDENGNSFFVYEQVYNDSLTAFTPGTYNPVIASWNNYFDFSDLQFVENGINRGSLSRVSGLHSNFGSVADRYETLDNTQYSLSASAGFDIVGKGKEQSKHSLKFGILYEQRVDRAYSIDPYILWQIGSQELNGQRIKTNAMVSGDTTYYDFGYGQNSTFANNLLAQLGASNVGEYVNLDALGPDDMSLGLFGADELISNNDVRLRYRGYDFKGDKVGADVSFNDFFTAKDANGEFSRPVAPVQPIYTAFYLQDKFTFKDIYFNVGLRIDRYDANTKVLKDPYSLNPILTVSEATGVNHATGADPNWYVYVDGENVDTPYAYRDGDQWFDASGDAVNDPSSLFGTRLPSPLVENELLPNEPGFDPDKVFVDYEPQINVMPRLSFSFPISEDAGFFAHYDILTRRPTTENVFSALDYYNWANRFNTTGIQNPDLKPSKTIDYQVGFQQRVSSNSAVTVTAYYREQRDLIATRPYTYATPFNYSTFGNRDFGTVKGLTFQYDMRRTKNLRLKLDYTLQFAEGTGSSSTSGRGVTSLGDIRPFFPYSFDQRHNITTTVDYRFGEGKKYNGPKLFGKNTLENFGVNILLNVGSGRPYTREADPASFGGNNTVGEFNGSRLPWTNRIDLRVDKDFRLGKKADALYLNAFLMFQNLFNTGNVIEVYSYSQSAEDDGWLSSSLGQVDIQNNSPGYAELYRLRMIDQGFYTLPRRIRMGVIFSF